MNTINLRNQKLSPEQLEALAVHLSCIPNVGVNVNDDLFVDNETNGNVVIGCYTYADGINRHALNTMFEYLADRMANPIFTTEKSEADPEGKDEFIEITRDQARRLFQLDMWRRTLWADDQMELIAKHGISFSFETEDDIAVENGVPIDPEDWEDEREEPRKDLEGNIVLRVSGFPELTGGSHYYAYYKLGDEDERLRALESIIFRIADRSTPCGDYRKVCYDIDNGQAYYSDAPTSDFVVPATGDAVDGYRFIHGIGPDGYMTNDPKRPGDRDLVGDFIGGSDTDI